MHSSSILSYPPPPAGFNYLAVIRPSLKLMLLCSAWSSALVPLLFALFLFSSRSLRRTPIFMLNVVSIIMGLALGVLAYYNGVSYGNPVSGYNNPRAPVITQAVFINALPLFTESILVLRVMTVYPLKSTPRLTLAIVYIPLCCLKVARLANILVFWGIWFPDILAGGNPIVVAQQSWDFPCDKIEWSLQMFDNAYASALFLYCLRSSRRVNGRIECARSKRPTRKYSERLSTLFWISVSNFVFPVMLSFVQSILAFDAYLFLDATYIIMSNIYFEIIAVLLATIWSAGSRRSEEQQATTEMSVSGAESPPRFATGTISMTTAPQVPIQDPDDITITVGSQSLIHTESASLDKDIESRR
ncbi:uncharacterized protein EV420DRAFT_1655020 [Desarmillaria tabescens]|uniref:Uncharacterized protein n=1 Tax=Armillaria tabescens TaxID=1929756 RepID=A0AA39MG47_ARMTA|nr:uncharacterized protein EV420DRAFT_1655020 [Desarmillaria tabescens]KAK0433052.1 hypothetical protein EV420DRAFT_1655020 [Desarmillaria tabescens]